MDQTEKVQENRLRRKADRQGLRLEKSRRRDPQAIDYGRYRLVDARHNAVAFGAASFDFEATLEEIEDYLSS